MRLVAGILLLLPLLAGCGGWHPLYADPSAGIPTVDSYSASIDSGTVSPGNGTANQNSLVTFVATPTTGFQVATYAVNGGTPVNVAQSNPAPGGGVPFQVSLPITQNGTTVVFTTVAIAPATNG